MPICIIFEIKREIIIHYLYIVFCNPFKLVDVEKLLTKLFHIFLDKLPFRDKTFNRIETLKFKLLFCCKNHKKGTSS